MDPLVPFTQVTQSFANQVQTFEHMASSGFQVPALPGFSGLSTVSTNIPATMLNTPSGGVSGASAIAGISGILGESIFSSRVVAILVGLVFVGGAIFLFKGPDIISSATKVAEIGA